MNAIAWFVRHKALFNNARLLQRYSLEAQLVGSKKDQREIGGHLCG